MNLSRRSTLVALLGLVGAPFKSYAHGAYDFARLSYNQKINSLPTWAIDGDCLTSEDSFYDCSFFDPNGIQYVIFDKEVMWIKLDVSKYKQHVLPFTVKRSDKRSVVIGKVRSRIGKIYSEYDSQNYHAFFLSDESTGIRLELLFDSLGSLLRIDLNSTFI